MEIRQRQELRRLLIPQLTRNPSLQPGDELRPLDYSTHRNPPGLKPGWAPFSKFKVYFLATGTGGIILLPCGAS